MLPHAVKPSRYNGLSHSDGAVRRNILGKCLQHVVRYNVLIKVSNLFFNVHKALLFVSSSCFYFYILAPPDALVKRIRPIYGIFIYDHFDVSGVRFRPLTDTYFVRIILLVHCHNLFLRPPITRRDFLLVVFYYKI
ncbi:hypothetical protein SDC9_159379 [bioreactor metagenome]|uniref:Uncharacterized protein n=1 Tax=bioreactor metagenome TaxID=1076179 RepID=A0A645FFE5_9ZZZZ